MKTIEVVAAVIKKGDEFLATERGYGDLKGYWEFPGGKVEKGETNQQALKREIMEEMRADIKVGDFLTTVEYDYPQFHLIMHCYLCELAGDKIDLLEHLDAKWLHIKELDNMKWCPADVQTVDAIKSYFSK